jgi:Tol biopolymer transport system component
LHSLHIDDVVALDVFKKQPTPTVPAKHTQVTSLGKAFTPAISPDGTYSAYVSRESSDNAQVIVHNLDTGQSLAEVS